jgi:large subunit ribosomal protein L10
MAREEKEEIVEKLAELLSRCTIAIVTDYRGMSVAMITQLRRKLREAGIEYHIVKNTLTQLAAEKGGKEGLKDLLCGPSAIAFGYGEITEPAKVLVSYISSSRSPLSIKGGILDGRVLTAEETLALATLPPKEILISELIGEIQTPIVRLISTLQTPISGLITLLSANLNGLITVLQARKQQLKGD